MPVSQSFRITSLAVALSMALMSAAFATESNLEVKAGQPVLHAGDSAPAFLVKVAYPDGRVVSSEMLAGEKIAIDPRSPGAGYSEGYYQVELSPIMGFAQRSDESAGRESIKASTGETITRGFRVFKGEVYVSNGPESASSSNDSDYGVRRKDQVFVDDLIVQASGCFGFDCVNNENFGSDTIRLKENNLRIHFDDTSNSGSFPSNDWRIVANDSVNGGASYLAIEDSSAGRTPFRVVAGARANALYVDSNGRVGFGTSTPSVDIHDRNGNTPTLRLEQDGSSGFTAQTWDVAGNEAGFFVRDVTNSSTLPFRIRPGAPSSSIDIASNGNVAIGTSNKNQKLYVFGATSTPAIFESTSTTGAYVGVKDANGIGYVGIINGSLVFQTAGSSFSDKMAIDISGNVGIGTSAPSGKLDVNSDTLRLRNSKTPSSSSDSCTTGEIAWDTNFVYVCVGTNSWRRSALSSW